MHMKVPWLNGKSARSLPSPVSAMGARGALEWWLTYSGFSINISRVINELINQMTAMGRMRGGHFLKGYVEVLFPMHEKEQVSRAWSLWRNADGGRDWVATALKVEFSLHQLVHLQSTISVRDQLFPTARKKSSVQWKEGCYSRETKDWRDISCDHRDLRIWPGFENCAVIHLNLIELRNLHVCKRERWSLYTIFPIYLGSW